MTMKHVYHVIYILSSGLFCLTVYRLVMSQLLVHIIIHTPVREQSYNLTQCVESSVCTVSPDRSSGHLVL